MKQSETAPGTSSGGVRARGAASSIDCSSSTKPQSRSTRALICAKIESPESCSANGVTAVGHSPVLKLCRKLVAAGYDPESRLEVYRGAVLALSICSIGKASTLVVEANSHGCPRVRRRRKRVHWCGGGCSIENPRASALWAGEGEEC